VVLNLHIDHIQALLDGNIFVLHPHPGPSKETQLLLEHLILEVLNGYEVGWRLCDLAFIFPVFSPLLDPFLVLLCLPVGHDDAGSFLPHPLLDDESLEQIEGFLL